MLDLSFSSFHPVPSCSVLLRSVIFYSVPFRFVPCRVSLMSLIVSCATSSRNPTMARCSTRFLRSKRSPSRSARSTPRLRATKTVDHGQPFPCRTGEMIFFWSRWFFGTCNFSPPQKATAFLLFFFPVHMGGFWCSSLLITRVLRGVSW